MLRPSHCIVALLSLAACEPQSHPYGYTPSQTAMGGSYGPHGSVAPRALAVTTEVRDSQFEREVVLLGPEFPWDGHPHNIQRIRSFKSKSSTVTGHQLYVESYYDEPRTGGVIAWYRAAADTGDALEFVAIEHKRIPPYCRVWCTHSEVFGITLPQALLTTRQRDGLQVKIYARDGRNAILRISVGQISQQLEAFARLGPAPSPMQKGSGS